MAGASGVDSHRVRATALNFILLSEMAKGYRMIRSKMLWVSCAALAILFAAPAGAVDFSLFGDVSVVGGDRAEDISTFRLGKLNLLVNQDIDDTSRANAEIIFEDNGHGIETDIERFAVTYAVDDRCRRVLAGAIVRQSRLQYPTSRCRGESRHVRGHGALRPGRLHGQ